MSQPPDPATPLPFGLTARDLPTLIPELMARYQDLPEGVRPEARSAVERALASASPEDWQRLLRAFATAGSDWGPYDADPMARRVARAFMEPMVEPESAVLGLEGVNALLARVRAGARGVLVGNHLSYVDTTATWALLLERGQEDAADRITAVAGPKVYEDPFRRLAAVALHTLKVPQSSRLAHNEAGLSAREVGRVAVESLRHARALTARGRLLLLYPEGGRSRTGRLSPFLSATARYLAEPGTVVLPFALTGTEVMWPIGAERLRPARLRLAFGAPIDADAEARGGAARERLLGTVYEAVAALLPDAYRPPPP